MQDFLSEIKNDKKKLIAVVAFAAIFVYIDLSYLLKAQVQEISATKVKIVKLQTDINNVKRDVSMMQQNQDKEKIPLVNKKILSEGELLSLLENISLIARNNSVRVTQINPQKGARPASKPGQPQQPYLPVMIKLDLSCNYHSLGSFINELENSEFAVSTEDVRINPEAGAGQRERVYLTLKTYVKI